MNDQNSPIWRIWVDTALHIVSFHPVEGFELEAQVKDYIYTPRYESVSPIRRILRRRNYSTSPTSVISTHSSI